MSSILSPAKPTVSQHWRKTYLFRCLQKHFSPCLCLIQYVELTYRIFYSATLNINYTIIGIIFKRTKS